MSTVDKVESVPREPEPQSNNGASGETIQGSNPPQPQLGIVSSENSVASSSTASSKLTAVLAAASANAVLHKPSDASDEKIKPASETSSSRPSTSSDSPAEEEKKEDDGDSPAADGEAGPLSTTDANNALLLHMSAPPHHPVAEFLFQLTKMLTDDNSEFIEWKHSSILVHDPPGLEKLILPKYFRHSNYSSFQRQMNYFGFRKIAGKGKMAACSYVNENAKEDISSLLYIKRKKTGVSGSAAKLLAQANKMNRVGSSAVSFGAANMGGGMNGFMTMQGNNMMNGMNQNSMMMNAMGGGMMGMNPHQMAFMQQQQQNNFMGGMGLPNCFQGMQGMGMQNSLQNMYPPKLGSSPGSGLNELSLLKEQQSILAQLQQAHASAAGNNVSTPSSLMDSFGFTPSANSAAILTNDQGNLYTAPNPEWGANDPQAQSLFMQQAAAMGGLGGFPQRAVGMGGMGDKANNEKGLDSAANLRSLLNQQISLFQDGTQAPVPNGAAAMGMPGAGRMGINPEQAANLPQGLSYEQFLSLNGMAGGAANGGEAGQFFQRN